MAEWRPSSAASAILAAFQKTTDKNRGRLTLSEEDLEVIEQAFVECDTDFSGALSETELQDMWRKIFPQMPVRELREMADALYPDLDPNGDGCVSWPEFETYFRGKSKDEWNDIDRMVHGTTIAREATRKELMWTVMDMETTEYENPPEWLGICKFIVAFISNMTILLSIASLIAESTPDQYRLARKHTGAAYRIETICLAIFTFEFAIRMLCSPSCSFFLTSYWTWCDIFAIVPFYIDLIASDDSGSSLVALRIVRLFRLLRLLRIMKVGRHMEAVQVLVIALSRTFRALMVSMVGVNSIGITLIACLVVTAERHQAVFEDATGKWIRNNNSEYWDAGMPIRFQTIPQGMWWAWVTLTTVGYGDMSPSTGPGKCVASFAMLLGLVLMAFPLTLLANSFGKTMDELDTKKEAKQRSITFSLKLSQARDQMEQQAAEAGEGKPQNPQLGIGSRVASFRTSFTQNVPNSRDSQQGLLAKQNIANGPPSPVAGMRKSVSSLGDMAYGGQQVSIIMGDDDTPNPLRRKSSMQGSLGVQAYNQAPPASVTPAKSAPASAGPIAAAQSNQREGSAAYNAAAVVVTSAKDAEISPRTAKLNAVVKKMRAVASTSKAGDGAAGDGIGYGGFKSNERRIAILADKISVVDGLAVKVGMLECKIDNLTDDVNRTSRNLASKVDGLADQFNSLLAALGQPNSCPRPPTSPPQLPPSPPAASASFGAVAQECSTGTAQLTPTVDLDAA